MTLLGYLAGYRGFTRDAYALDLRQFTAWCWQHDHQLFDVHRVDIECFARDLEELGKARATVARRLCTIVGFYRYAEEEGVIEHSPAVHIRRPRIEYESHVAHLDRNELGAILVAAGLSSPRDHALVSLLALNGLRVSEAIGATIEALGQERGHRTLSVMRKGGRLVTMPLAPRVARAIDLAVGERLDGPIFVDNEGQRLDRHAAGGSCDASPAAPRSANGSDRTPCDTPSSPPPWTPACHCVTCKKRPVTPTRARQCVMTGAGSPSTGTPLTSSPPSSPAPPADTTPCRCSVRCERRTPDAGWGRARPTCKARPLAGRARPNRRPERVWGSQPTVEAPYRALGRVNGSIPAGPGNCNATSRSPVDAASRCRPGLHRTLLPRR